MVRRQIFQILKIMIVWEKWSFTESLFHQIHTCCQYWQSEASGTEYGVHRLLAAANQSFPYAKQLRFTRRIELQIQRWCARLSWSAVCFYSFASSFTSRESTKLVPLSLMIVCGLPCLAVKRVIAILQASVSRLYTTSIWTARVVKQVTRQRWFLTVFRKLRMDLNNQFQYFKINNQYHSTAPSEDRPFLVSTAALLVFCIENLDIWYSAEHSSDPISSFAAGEHFEHTQYLLDGCLHVPASKAVALKNAWLSVAVDALSQTQVWLSHARADGSSRLGP